MIISSRLRRMVALSVVAILALVGALAVVVSQQGQKASGGFQQERSKLTAALRQAEHLGFTKQDLQPISTRLASIDARQAPFWLTDRGSFYSGQTRSVQELESALTAREQQLLEGARTDASSQVTGDRAALDRSRQIGVDDATLAPLEQRLSAITQSQGSAGSLTEFRRVSGQAQNLNKDIVAASAAQEQENQALLAGGVQLKAQTNGSIDAMRSAGQAALAAGRNDATVAAYLNKPSPFKGWAAVTVPYSRLERYSTMLGSADPDQVALSAFALQRYAGQIHDGLTSSLPSRTIVVSHQAQQLWAYENGQQVLSTLVTTGRPQLPTDIGPMKVLSHSHPWTMKSPWPKDSPWYYPDTVVQYVLWFTNTGEGLHDASWQGCCYGPGSEYNQAIASHGCIHVPLQQEITLFNWAPNGTPVIVYPGDGTSVDHQLSQITTDDQGRPLSGPSGAPNRGA